MNKALVCAIAAVLSLAAVVVWAKLRAPEPAPQPQYDERATELLRSSLPEHWQAGEVRTDGRYVAVGFTVGEPGAGRIWWASVEGAGPDWKVSVRGEYHVIPVNCVRYVVTADGSFRSRVVVGEPTLPPDLSDETARVAARLIANLNKAR